MNTRQNELEADLVRLIAKHGWLSGPEWAEVTDHVGNGFFRDMPTRFDPDTYLSALHDKLVDDFVASA